MDLYTDDFDRISNIPDVRIKQLFNNPRGHWYCVGNKHLHKSVDRFMRRVNGKVPVMVIYNIPNRDLGNFSKGGAEDMSEYLNFIISFCRGLKDRQAIIIFEPDAIPHAIAQGEVLLTQRINLMNAGLKIISMMCPNAIVYVDVGHPRWIDANFISKILKRVYNYRGISINVSNFVPDEECVEYGNAIGKPFVIDSSRNGSKEKTEEWCNPPGRKIGRSPEMVYEGLLDGYLWIKVPGESDGKCNGGPKAGKFWKEYAEGLLNEIEN